MSLKVTDAIPYGNVSDVLIAGHGDTCRVEFAASAHGGPERLWFCFRLEAHSGSPRPTHLQLVLKHVTTMLAGYRQAEYFRPVIRTAGEDWTRLASGSVESFPDGRMNVTWSIDPPSTFCDIALCYPYGRPELEALVEDTGGYWRLDTIGMSQADRPILRLSNDYGSIGDARPGLFLIARQHSGETPGSWVLDGLLRELAGRDDAPLVWGVPLSNIDGIEQGDYGKDNFPCDLNRAWGVPMRHETLVIQRDMRNWAERCTPLLGVDFHAPGGTEYEGAYSFLPKPEQFPELHEQTRRWTEHVGAALGEYASADFSRIATYASRWQVLDLDTLTWHRPSFGHFCTADLRMPAFTLETPYAMIGDILMGREQYREMGGRIAHALMRMCNQMRPR